MVLRYVILGVGILGVYDSKSSDLDALLNPGRVVQQPVVEQPAPTPEVPPALVSNQVPSPAAPAPIPKPGLPLPSAVVPEIQPAPAPEPISEPIVGAPIPKPGFPPTPGVVPGIQPAPAPMPIPQSKPFTPGVQMVPNIPAPAAVSPLAQPQISQAQPGIEQQQSVEATAEVTSEGLDTLNIDTGGNWLEKRKWYHAAEQEYEAIHKLVQKTVDIRTKFVHEVSIIGKSIDDFYEKVSFEKGQIDELLQAVVGTLTTEEKVRGGDLSSSERGIKEKIHADQQAFGSIESTMKSITDLDDQVSKTMMKAFQEIDACSALEAKAWNNFKEIGIILDDKKARVLYYEIENFYKNIEKKIDYLQSNLLTYLQNQLSSKITQQISQIQTTVNALKEKGLNLETLLQKDSAGDFVIFKEREELKAKEAMAQSQAEAKAAEAQAKAKAKHQEASWYQNLWCTILEYLCPIFTKLSEWAAIVWCCIQTLLCKIQEMICKLFGY